MNMENDNNNNNSSALWLCSCGEEAVATVDVLGKYFDVCETCYDNEMDDQFDASQNWDHDEDDRDYYEYEPLEDFGYFGEAGLWD